MSAYDEVKLREMLIACKSAKTRASRGSTFEDFVQSVFESVPSVAVFGRDVKDDSGSQELDLVFSHYHFQSNFPITDVTVIVECKNEKRRTSAAQIREFGYKLRTRGLNVGVLVTMSGLSGKSGTAGHSAIRDELMAGASIIVVTAEELSNLTCSDDLGQILKARLLELRTFRTYLSL
jgi:hypothetical protein